MVSFSDVAEPQVDVEVVDGLEPSEPEVEVEPQVEVEPDPLAELRQRLDGAASREELLALSQKVSSELGRAQRLEARIAELPANPLADVDPRLDANEALLTSIADALISSALTDDATKGALQSARSRLTEATGKRAEQRMRAELTAEVLKSLPQPQEQTAPQVSVESASATERVVGYAEAKGVNPADIPESAWNLVGNESLDQAVARVKGVVDSLAEQDAAATRVASRRTAAGPGTPARVGTNSIESTKQRLQSEGIPLTDRASRQAIADSLGIELPD